MEDIAAENRTRADKLEQASVNAANEGLKALLLLNGGACIALISFLAASISSGQTSTNPSVFVAGFSRSLVWFAMGAGLAVLTSFFNYLSNQSYSSHLRNPAVYKRSWSIGHAYTRLGLVGALGSLVAFAIGVYKIWAVTNL